MSEATKSKLETLLEKQKALETQIAEEKAKEEANKILNAIGADVAAVVQKAAKEKGVQIAVLHGKFFALSVADGKLAVEVVSKVRKANGGGNSGNGNGNGNGDYDYFLKDGRGPFESVQKAMDALGVKAENRPSHNRYDRLSADWKDKIVQKAKAEKPAEQTAEAEKPEQTAEAGTEQTAEAEKPEQTAEAEAKAES